jgi:ABC-type amino acid transport substrate-binding protein
MANKSSATARAFSMQHRVVALSLAALIGIGLSACATVTPASKAPTGNGSENKASECVGSDGLNRVVESGVLRIAASKTAPYSWQDIANGTWRGYDADIISEVADRMGVKVEVAFSNTAGVVGSVNSGRADMSNGLLQTPERAEAVGFTGDIRWITTDVIVRDDDHSINDLDDLKDKKIATGVGNAGATAAEALKTNGLIADLITTQEQNDAFIMLETKRVDAVIFPYSNLEASVSTDGAKKFKFKRVFALDPKWYGGTAGAGSRYAVAKSDCGKALAEIVTGHVDDMREDGTMEKIFTSYGITQKLWLPESAG